MGVIRRHRTVSGLIKYQPKGDPPTGPPRPKAFSPPKKRDAIVVMLGLDDRVAIREPAADKSDNKPSDKGERRTLRPNPMASLQMQNPP